MDILNQTKDDQGLVLKEVTVAELSFSSDKRNQIVTVICDGVNSKLVFIDWHGSYPKCEGHYIFHKQVLRKASFNPKDET